MPDPDPLAARSWPRIPFAAQVVLAMLLGLVLGLVFGERVAPLSKLGSVILDLVKALAAPLLLFAVLDAFLRTDVKARSGGLMVAIALTNASIALLIGLTISNLLQPGHSLRLDEGGSEAARSQFAEMAKAVQTRPGIEFLDDLLRLVPKSVVRPLLENDILAIVILAVLAGSALRKVKSEQIRSGQGGYLVIESFVATAYRAVEIMLSWVIKLVPLAVLGVVASTVGKFGLSPLRGLAVYLAVGILGLGIQVAVVYQTWLVMVARMPLTRFWTGAREALLYALGCGSSLATLPLTLQGLDRMGVSPQSARMAACVGTNLNNDGILLYEAMAVLFVAQACGVHLSVGQQMVAAASCALAGIGISGIPEAGLISLLLVLKTVRVVPDEQIALIVPSAPHGRLDSGPLPGLHQRHQRHAGGDPPRPPGAGSGRRNDRARRADPARKRGVGGGLGIFALSSDPDGI